MTFRADDGKTACCFDLVGEFDVRATTRHIGRDSDSTFLTSLCDDISLFLVQLGIQHLVRDLTQFQHL